MQVLRGKDNIFFKIISQLLLTTFLIILSQNSYSQKVIITRERVYATKGKVTIPESKWQDYVFGLYGQWEFYWNKLLTPEQIDSVSPDAYVDVPNTWTKYTINGRQLPKFGYATYHIQIDLPPDVHEIGLCFHGVFNSYRLWVNGKFIDENGKVGTSKQNTRPTWVPKTYYLHINQNKVDLVIQVSNFQHFKGGIVRQVVIGAPALIEKFDILNVGIEAGLMGSLLIFALFFLFVYYYRKNDLGAIYFVVTLIGQALATGLDGEYIIYRLMPNMSWYFGLHLLWFIYFYRTITFVHYMYQLVPREFNIKVLVGFTGLGTIFMLYTVFMPVSQFKIALLGYIAIAFMSIFYIIYILFRAIKYQIGAVYTLLGVAALLASGINDTLYDFNIVHTFYMAGFGLFIFLFTLSIMLAMYNAKAEKDILIYSLMLRTLDKLRDELLKVPFYDIGKALKVVNNLLKFQRGIWIDNDNGLIAKHEIKLNKLKDINKPFDQLDDNYLSKDAVNISLKTKKIYFYPGTRHDRRLIQRKSHKLDNPVSQYLIAKNIKSLVVNPLVYQKDVKALVYFENAYRFTSPIQIKLLTSSSAQLISIYHNAKNFARLRDANIHLEQLVAERSQQLKDKEKELHSKEIQLKEKLEKLRAYNDELNAINLELEQNKTAIEEKNFELEKLHNEILKQKMLAEQQNKKYKSGLSFAKEIQSYILQIDSDLPFSDYFIFYQPKLDVGGDFYLIKKIEDKTIIVVADCTGHGIPGAFMSILGSMHINDILRRHFITEKTDITAAQILEELREAVIRSLGSDEHGKVSIETVKDGMDMGLAIINNKTLELNFSGAYIPLWIIRENELIELKANRFPIGVYIKLRKNAKFTDTTFQLKKEDRLYMFSDGFADQFNSIGEKFYKKNFRKLLMEIAEYPSSLQKEILHTTFNEWKGQSQQTDDVLVLGIII